MLHNEQFFKVIINKLLSHCWSADLRPAAASRRLALPIAFLFVISTGITLVSSPANASSKSLRTLSFSGQEWIVKSSVEPVGPGPNYFSDSTDNVWVDGEGKLHLKITQRNGVWYCAEVISVVNFGYGTYRFYTDSRIDQLDQNVVLGLFTWDDDPAYHHREIDIEFSKWGQDVNENAQFVVQPWDTSGNMHRFNIELTGLYSTHSFAWNPGEVFFQCAHGHYATPPATHIIESWSYTGPDNPPPGNENARLNLWLYQGVPPSDAQEAEVIISKFEFEVQKNSYLLWTK